MPPFAPGDRVLLIDQRDRTYLFTLREEGAYHTHAGLLPHGELIGKNEGTRVTTSTGMVLTAFRPRFPDFVLKMPRGAQVVYPKDLGPILIETDIFPGARVLEAGTGSGALAAALCRAVGESGRVVSYEVRAEHGARAESNLVEWFGGLPPQLELRSGDIAEVSGTDDRFDRVVMDLPEPWAPLAALTSVLDPGGVVCAYLPTTIQVQQYVVALPAAGFHHVETFETMRRGWHVTERSVRPDHRMVGHTGFLTLARLISNGGP
jgi:tRNA (adenine57-N1/adenine58-N1)-methyltransferase